MDKGILLCGIVAVCVGAGSAAGGYEAWSQESFYRRVLKDPGFYHLVDEAGQPVSQDFHKS